jgi:isopenicillin-N epimerase
MKDFKSDFLLENDLIFLNHGSFGACPQPVFEAYQDWQLQLERQPVRFLGRQANDLLAESRSALANYLNTAADNLVYTTNPTTAMNIALGVLFVNKKAQNTSSKQFHYRSPQAMNSSRFSCPV